MADDYQLLDFGHGRKLESFSGYLVDRPSPAAIDAKPLMQNWHHADAVFDESARQWLFRRAWPKTLYVAGPGFRLPVVPTPFGHLQVFPEQQPHWQWLHRRANELLACEPATPLQALNLFAYTGGSTFAMATGGAATVHVDAARPNVAAAKTTAERSNLSHLPIRYLVDDALKFVKREQRRGRVYQLVALDPPAYGHSPDGHSWRIERDLEPLLRAVVSLLDKTRGALLVTGHSPGFDGHWVKQQLLPLLQQPLDRRSATIEQPMEMAETGETDGSSTSPALERPLSIKRLDACHVELGRSTLTDVHQRKLDAGFFVRVHW